MVGVVLGGGLGLVLGTGGSCWEGGVGGSLMVF